MPREADLDLAARDSNATRRGGGGDEPERRLEELAEARQPLAASDPENRELAQHLEAAEGLEGRDPSLTATVDYLLDLAVEGESSNPSIQHLRAVQDTTAALEKLQGTDDSTPVAVTERRIEAEFERLDRALRNDPKSTPEQHRAFREARERMRAMFIGRRVLAHFAGCERRPRLAGPRPRTRRPACPRRRGSRRATGTGSRAGPDDPDASDPPGDAEALPAGGQIAEPIGAAA